MQPKTKVGFKTEFFQIVQLASISMARSYEFAPIENRDRFWGGAGPSAPLRPFKAHYSVLLSAQCFFNYFAPELTSNSRTLLCLFLEATRNAVVPLLVLALTSAP